jgi:hypothetical protein
MSEKKQDFGSKYLYAEDLLSGGEYRTATVTIAEVIPAGTLTAANGQQIDKPTLRFEGKDKMLVLCKTNQSMVVLSCGEQLEKSVGHSITLQPREVAAFGEQVLALRIIPPPGVKVRKRLAKELGTKAVWKK